ncbi:uncharacterized protein K460DRAFT_362810 [Cucurbitaria berberidis CBS 394.84]|uniref:Uncharacterized protein n=1 Tax=Cucurbitaria berberidis CBS 394.84 TaxID=1168544 RepID=A0A9P4GUJ7_9PLEO|nr:uncharacterized protein K460DRAFT_362810 [Cucurbitaria berberidis CBS 394.84]KAF1852045.1 hypothetical protein K460DRAFT_362810 [Cucurbitaria berberidis CBS 394.84]
MAYHNDATTTRDNHRDDPYWSRDQGRNSHPTKVPTQDPHDPKPRNPKRRQDCRSESSGHRHLRLERKHDRREKERDAVVNGTAVPPPNAGPNWAKNREAALIKYARNTRRRHKKHEKRQRAMQKGEVEAREASTSSSQDPTPTTDTSAREDKKGAEHEKP